MAGYAIWAYGGGRQRVPVLPDMAAVFDAHRALIPTHAVGAAFALLLGPFQFLDGWRARQPRAHRVTGYLYLTLGVGVGGVPGSCSRHIHSADSFPTWASAAWHVSGCSLAVVSARRRHFDDHRRWMIRNFALSLAAVTLRIYLPASVVAGIAFEKVYPAVAWLCWVPNLILVEWYRRPSDHTLIRGASQPGTERA